MSAAAAVILALMAGGATTWWQAQRAERRFNDVRRLAHTLMFDIWKEMRDKGVTTGADLARPEALALEIAKGDAALR